MKSDDPPIRKPSARSNPSSLPSNRIANLDSTSESGKRKTRSKSKAAAAAGAKTTAGRAKSARDASHTGAVYWLTGLSGSGKTTLAKRLARRLRQTDPATVLLDGEALRIACGRDLGYSLADRRKASARVARLCRMISDQGIDVVCATISLFHEIQRWNRRNMPGYVEIYLDVPLPELHKRDPQGTYARALLGEIDQVIGVDLPMEEPEHPDVHLVVQDETARATMDRLWAAVEEIRAGNLAR